MREDWHVHLDFADWYRTVSIEPKEEDLQKRWRAIESLRETVGPSELAELVRLFFGLPSHDDKFLAKFRGVFKAADDAFPMRDNDPELRILAGATLAHHFPSKDSWGTASALAVLSADCQGHRTAPVPPILSHAEQSLSERAGSLRKSNEHQSQPQTDFSAELQALKAAFPQNNVSHLSEPLTNVLQAMAGAVAHVSALASRLQGEQGLRKEESEVLWWLFGEHSRDLRQPFSELKSPSACLIGAKELSDLTQTLPGPFAAEAFLDKVLRLAHPTLTAGVSIAEAVTACLIDWQRSLIAANGTDSLADLCPVHLAATKSVEVEGKKTWYGPFQSLAGFKPTVKMAPLCLAVQAYRERLFLRAFSELEEAHDA
jgi:hypothetical protein